ncbi:MAG: CHAT domain-containing protein [Candidatus Aminicenantes bacterium]|nr:CHAT domain-containing protein [Candidatus Aminicenantes bacterium]NIM84027.1 CHAT domain-containing protein [Candidatus Aminicenantes bacterium]NIN18805.1 CHAT domain-containing protein [Candidatus Aminicenantes bacterium]NIN42727.1 CHAT domain-containing protein [Candidatus Aminicenantes bacterium]NIN85461.1 CHAT domain-containing protein [Candidatus Aminicenantes bacterium]
MVLAGKDGGIHAVEAVEISRIAIRDASKYVDPKHWGEPDEVEPDIIIKNISEHLAPLVNALNPLVDKGVLKPGDHICYSGDDHFSNIPLQYLLFNGKPMIHCFTLSRIQNASHLVEVLSRPARKAPRQFVSFIAPLKQDTTKENWDEINQNFHKPTECLKQLLNTNDPVYKNQSATISQLCREDLCDKIIQFSTHGIFPLQTEIGNPFEQSGLVLAHNGELPDSDAVGSGNLEGVLTPRTILDLNLDFNESHLSLTACVSGLSKEGIGGDALGIEWALIQKGAGSILSSHWFVSAESAARFFECYYTHWIKEKKSRAKAYSAAIKTLNEEQSPDWAAFSLTGDWR